MKYKRRSLFITNIFNPIQSLELNDRDIIIETRRGYCKYKINEISEISLVSNKRSTHYIKFGKVDLIIKAHDKVFNLGVLPQPLLENMDALLIDLKKYKTIKEKVLDYKEYSQTIFLIMSIPILIFVLYIKYRYFGYN